MGSESREAAEGAATEPDADPVHDVEPDSEHERDHGQSGATAGAGADGDEEEVDTSHLDGAADGCGCTEMWEHLADQRGE